MANKSRILGTALSAALLPGVIADFALFEPGLISNSSNVLLSKGCVDALQSNMRCDPYLQKIVSTDTYSYLDPSLLDTLCTADCGHSLASYHASVKLSCVNDPLPWPGTPPELYGDQIWAAYNMTCLKDTSNGYCQSKFMELRSKSVTDLTCSRLLCQPNSWGGLINCGSTKRRSLLALRPQTWSTQPGYLLQQLW